MEQVELTKIDCPSCKMQIPLNDTLANINRMIRNQGTAHNIPRACNLCGKLYTIDEVCIAGLTFLDAKFNYLNLSTFAG